MTIGEQVRDGRESKALTQRELADRVGRAHSAISRLESGASRSVDLALLEDIATETQRAIVIVPRRAARGRGARKRATGI